MTDKKILDEVYKRLREGEKLIGGYEVVADYIEKQRARGGANWKNLTTELED